MPKKKSLASLELRAVVNELQFLKGAKVDQIYHPEKDELLIRFHVSNEGKKILRIIPGSLLNLTNEKKETLAPSSFCLQLRKYLSNATLGNIDQQHSERIVVMEFKKEERYRLMVELFSKGNILLVDRQEKIIATLNQQTWKDRTIKGGEQYLFPEEGFHWQESTVEDLQKMFQKSTMDSLVKSLAMEMGLGGTYAEEICVRVGVNKKTIPDKITTEETKKIHREIQRLLQEATTPQGLVYETTVSPVRLQSFPAPLQTLPTYNEAVDSLRPLEKTSPHQKRIRQLQFMMQEQEETIKELETEMEENTKKGELVYQHYPKLDQLLTIVQKLQRTSGWSAVEKELRTVKKIKHIDLKNKKITIEL